MGSSAEIYLSYALNDEPLIRELEKHLLLLKRSGLIAGWYDSNARLVEKWAEEEDAHLDTASIFLLCISPDFFALDHCYSIELRRALERHAKGEALAIVVILRPTAWQDTPISHLSALPAGNKPISQWLDLDEAFLNVTQGIRSILAQRDHIVGLSTYQREIAPEGVVSLLPVTAREAMGRGDIKSFREELNNYFEGHPHERLLTKGGETLYYEHPARVMYAWQLWMSLAAVFSSGMAISLLMAEELVQMLADVLAPTRKSKVQLHDTPTALWALLDVQRLFDNTRIPNHLPIFLHKGPTFDREDAVELFSLLKSITPRSRTALLLLFVDGENLPDIQRTILKGFLQRTYACDVIPLISSDFLKILDARKPERVFRRFFISKVDLAVVSPFVTSGPAPDDLFFGRERELRLIREQIKNSNHALVGGRRIGKTSILRHLLRFDLPAADNRVFYHDCSPTPTQLEVVQAVVRDRTWFPDGFPGHAGSFTDVVEALPSNRPIVILFDEADSLVAADRERGYALFKELRALANRGRCHFIFAGEQALRRELTNPASPMYNFPIELQIGCLEFEAVRELIIRPMREMEIDLVEEERLVRRIWDFTSGQPNVVQRLCQRLVTKLNNKQHLRLGIEDVEEAISDSDFLRRDFLGTYWESASPLERLCTLVMVRDQSLRTPSLILQELARMRLSTTLQEIDGALERLVALRNILRRIDGGYGFVASAFPEAVMKTHNLDDLTALCRQNFLNEGR
ncbi:MAG TPA: ATP-binding protein [Ktedonobacteraceae bacterium]|nr:ATP-binding protein [Ktedonobacteraceae bacterium]